MKILIVRTWPYELNLNSYNVQELGLARALVRAGHRCDIVLYREKGKSITEKRPDGVTIYWRRGLNLLKNGLFPGIRTLAKDYDIVQVHEYDQIQSWLLYAFPGKLHVVIYHGPYYSAFNRGYNFKCRVFDQTFLKIGKRSLAKVSCAVKSPLAADFLSKKGFKDVTPVGVGLNPDTFATAADTDCCNMVKSALDQMSRFRFRMLYIGKLEPRRNIDFLLRVAEGILKSNDDVQLTIIGTGEDSYVSTLAPAMERLNGTGQFIAISRATQTELKKIYEQADLLVFPSNYEIYGMVLAEAMYFGVPCISSHNGGSSMLIQDNTNGIIMEHFDEKEWEDRIQYCIDHPDRMEKMKALASQTVRDMFTWDAIVPKFMTLYERAIQK